MPDVDRILKRSLSLGERVRLPLRPSPDYARARSRRESAWARAVSPDDPDGFRRRLDRLAISRERVGEVLAAEPAASPSEAWADVFREVAAAVTRTSARRAPALLREASVPLAEALRPFLTCARRRLQAAVPDAVYQQFREEAIRDALGTLADDLWRTSAGALRAEFEAFRSIRTGDEADLRARFVCDMAGGRWLVFFEAYPVLARLLSQAVVCWVGATADLLRRLDSDRAALAATFDGAGGLVVGVRSGLSDPHRGRRTVAIVEFEGGGRVVYKPRDLSLEAVFSSVVERASGCGAVPILRTTGLLLRDGYGWMEFVDASAPDTVEDAERYYTRFGALLGLAHALCATDLHVENVIGAGEHPVLIDLEALASPALEVSPEIRFNATAWDRLRGSVLQTGLLPAPQGTRPSDPDVSALRGRSPGATDSASGPAGGASRDIAGPDAVCRAVIAGFEASYRYLMADRAALTAPDGPLAPLRSTPVRFLLRHTRVYGRLLDKLAHPRYLRDGLDRSLALDALARPLLTGHAASISWEALDAEIRDLETLDVPLFLSDPVRRNLDGGDGVSIEDGFDQSGYDRVVDRLGALCDEDLAYQCDLVRHALTPPTSVRVSPAGDTDGAASAWEGACVDAAKTVYAELARTAVRARGEATWLVPDPLDAAMPSLLRPLGPDLYKGACGVALFAAAYARVADDEDGRRLALEALRPLRDALRSPLGAAALAEGMGIGAGNGLGSLAYGLAQVSRLLDEPALLEDARAAADRITPDRIRSDTSLDVVGGAAGAIHGLLAVAHVSGDDRLVALARLCGDHLLENRQPSPTGRRAWATLGGMLGGGAAHGASGIAHALLRLHGATGQVAFRDAALEGFAFEQSLYLPDQRNWRSTSTTGSDAPAPCAWCHGAAGVVLSRVDGLSPRDAGSTAGEVSVGLGTVRARAAEAPDSLCCGSAGRADALLTSGLRLDRPDLRADAVRVARSIADRVRTETTSLATFRGHRSVGLFQGSSGVGYGLLRAVRPGLVPSVLVWESPVD